MTPAACKNFFVSLLLGIIPTIFIFQHSSIFVASSKVCQHGVLESAFPPKTFYRYLDDDFIKDFDEIMVIGDVHGCFDELMWLLQKANATEHNVLKILAGDFLKKGPQSLEVLRYIKNHPSVLTVRGNNDQKIIDMQYKSQKFQYNLAGDNDFIKYLTEDDMDFLRSLPYAILIPSLDAIIVHAGIRPGVQLELNEPFEMMNMRNIVPDHHCHGGFRPSLKHSKGVPWASEWKGPQHIIFGHDAGRSLQTYPLATGIDTRCVYGEYLTGYFIKGPRVGTLVFQKARPKLYEKLPAEEIFKRWVKINHIKISEENFDDLQYQFLADYAP